MNFEVAGKLHADLGTQQVTERFRRREFVLEVLDGQYPQFIKFQLTQDKCELLDSYRVGDFVKVGFNLTGRESKDRNGNPVYYTNLQAWRLDVSEPIVAPAGGYGRSEGGNAGGGYGGGGFGGGDSGGGRRNDNRGGNDRNKRYDDDRGGSRPKFDDGARGGKKKNFKDFDDEDDMPF